MANTNKNKIIFWVVILLVLLAGWFLFVRDRSESPLVEYSESIIGSWRNVEYSGLVREFKEGGVLEDRAGEGAIVGTWEMFSGDMAPESLAVSLDEEMVYLKINLTGNERDDIYFEVVSLTDEDLELNHFDRGAGPLSFTREE